MNKILTFIILFFSISTFGQDKYFTTNNTELFAEKEFKSLMIKAKKDFDKQENGKGILRIWLLDSIVKSDSIIYKVRTDMFNEKTSRSLIKKSKDIYIE